MADIRLTDDQRAELHEALTGWPVGVGYYATQVGPDDARGMVDDLAPLIERWLSECPPGWTEREEAPAVPPICRTYWGSHGCSLTHGHDGPHVCDCCEDPDGHAQRGPEHEEGIYCVGIPGHYGDTLTWTFFGEDV